jgi:glycosyltransferase involved in cell wall biosynthesis
MLTETDANFLQSLKSKARPIREKVNFLPPVPTEDIVSKISEFDLGIHIIPPLSINNKYALPNKFFEFIQGHLGIVVGPSPEMAGIVNERELGIVSKSFDAPELARAINALDRNQVDRFRSNSKISAEIFNWENESIQLVESVSRMIGTTNEDQA